MPLKITLKPNERMIIGAAVVTNGKRKSNFFIENKVPILRQRDIMNVKDADSPGSRIYFVIQLMYIDEGNLEPHYMRYWKLVQDFVKATPGKLGLIGKISENILVGKYYQALKLSRKLIVDDLEAEIYKENQKFDVKYYKKYKYNNINKSILSNVIGLNTQ
jgi:flagellar biosynthesis repressor protein FlbT